MRRRILLLAALALSLAGCAVGPDYQRPELELPAAFAVAAVGDGAAVVNREWWQAFDDPTLDRLVQVALRHNADMLQAIAAVERADALLREAGAALLPELGTEASAGRSRTSAAASPLGSASTHSSFRAVVLTSFELDFWGRLRRAREAALAQALGSRYARDTVALSLAGAVAQAYIALRALDAQVAVSQQSLENRDRTRRLIRNRYQGGIASPLEVQQAEGAYASAAAQLLELQRQLQLLENQLGVLTGQLDLRIPSGSLQSLPLPPVPPPGLPSALLELRPDIREAEARLMAASANIGVARAALFPAISLTGSLGSESRELSELLGSGSMFWSLGGRLDLPLFDAGRRRARVDQATAVQQEALAGYIGTVRNAFREVSDALVSLRQTAEIEEALAARVAAAQEALRLAEIRYEAGYSPFLEVLDAQRTLNEAELAYISNRQERLTASVLLFKALGGGWRSEG